MALIDVVKWESNKNTFCHKFPSDDLRIGTQLVVYPSQTAFFVKGGAVCDEFTSGTYTIKTENIPILNKLINLPFGKESPFKAEVWFVNNITRLGLKWGTTHPLNIEDPKYGIIVPVRAFGQYGLKVKESKLFLETLIGNMSSFDVNTVDQYFKGKLISFLTATISKCITKEKISILDINNNLIEISEFCNTEISKNFEKYGLQMVDFSIMSINVPQEDPAFNKLREAKAKVASFNVEGKEFYQMSRSFDVLDKVAQNQGAGGNMMAMGASLAAGLATGGVFGQMANNLINTDPQQQPPQIKNQTVYHVYLNGQQVGGHTVQTIANLIAQGAANSETLVWTAGMPEWARLSTIPELAQLLNQQTPPPIVLPQIP